MLAGAPAGASCPLPWLFSGIEPPEAYSYVATPGVDPTTSENGSSLTPQAVGFFWALGYGDPAGGLGHDGGVMVAPEPLQAEGRSWLIFDPGNPAFLLGTWAMSHAIDGCISQTPLPFSEQCMVLAVADQVDGAGYFAVATALPGERHDYFFHQPGNAPIVLAPIPAPTITAIKRIADGHVVVTLEPPDPSDGSYLEDDCHAPVVVGYRTRQVPVPPGAGAPQDRGFGAGWSKAAQTTTVSDLGGPLVPLGAAARVVLDCAAGEDHFLATTFVFDSGYETPFVSASSVRIPCRRCTDGVDRDGDGFCTVADGDLPRDCEDDDPSVFPWAPQVCDGRNNDCRDPRWPAPPVDELDADLDGFPACAGDCDDDDAQRSPVAAETCNGIDDDCSGIADDDAWGADSDADGHANACDNCPFTTNPDQTDLDLDGIGTACDACTDRDGDGVGDPAADACRGGPLRDCDDAEHVTHPGARELFDGRDNDCDGTIDEGLDQDGDGVPDHRDACPATPQGAGVDPSGCAVCP